MVHDCINSITNYIPTKYKDVVNIFIQNTDEDMDEGEYEIAGTDIFARIMSYETKSVEECVIEAHDVYCDIQFTLVGGEGISIFSRDSVVEVDKNEKNDFITFKEKDKPIVVVRNMPGYFSLIHTYEAHRPQEKITKKGYVKKGVIKIKENLFYE